MRTESRAKRNELLRAQISGLSEPPNNIKVMKSREIDDAVNRRAVRRKVDAGQINRAMKLISNDGKLMEADADMAGTALKKYPTGAPVTAIIRSAMPEIELNLDRETIMAAINGMSTASAAGRDGLRPSHLRQLIGDNAGPNRELQSEALCNFASICTSCKPLRSSSEPSLCAYRRWRTPNRCWLRNTSVICKAACFCLREPRYTIISASTRHWNEKWSSNSCSRSTQISVIVLNNSGLLKLDFKNPFYTVDRSATLAAVATNIPELLSFSQAAYSTPSHLFFGNYRLSSRAEFNKATLLGRCFLLSPYAPRPKPVCPFAIWYLDDGA